MSWAEARSPFHRRRFEAAGFRFGAVTFEPYEGISEGTILRQGPLPGHPLRRSDALSLVVAAPDPRLALVPDGRTIDAPSTPTPTTAGWR